MSDPPNRSSLRTRRPPPRADEVVSLAPRARATTSPEGSAPPEPVAPVVVEMPFAVQLNPDFRQEVELEPDFVMPGADEPMLSWGREPHDSVGHDDSDESMPALDSHEVSSEDEEHEQAVFESHDRGGLRATPVAPARGPQEGMALLSYPHAFI